MPSLVEFLYQALASPKGIILDTTDQSSLMLALIEAKKLDSDFSSIEIVAPKGRPNQVWLINGKS